MIFVSLINNIALLVAITILYSFILRKWHYDTIAHHVIAGMLFGCVTIVGMINPFVWTNGIIFDGRSIIISIAGFFGGPLTAFITAVIAAGFRIYLGGSGVYMGVTVIAGSAVIGIIFHALRKKDEKYNKPLWMYFFSLIVHIYMLAATIALPSKFTTEALYLISFPVLLLYPIGSLLVCILFQELIMRIKTQEALKKSEANYRELVEDIESLILRLDSGFNIIFMNKFAKKILLNGSENYSGKNFITDYLQITNFDRRENLGELFEKNGNTNQFFETEIKNPGDTVHWISWLISPVYTDKGEMTEALCVGTDITERKKSDEERLRLQHLEALGILAGGIAHDFNNILTVIMGKASLASIYIQDEKVKQMLDSITDATGRAKGLTQQLLTFAKGGAPEKKKIDLGKIIQETASFSVSGSSVRLSIELCHTFYIEADPAQISQVIQNLVINAVQAMPSGGEVKISTEDIEIDTEKFIRILISDTGTGISEENIDRIFNPYFTTKSTGTGLGLSICHSIIKHHDGKLSVTSEIDKGTTFEIHLPATDSNLHIQEKFKHSKVDPLSILIMDDDPDVLELLRSMLVHLGHKAAAATNGDEAVAVLKSHPEHYFDAAILDFTIKGGKGGLDTAREIRSLNPNIKIIISSGYLDTEIKEKVRDESIDTLDKPYTISKLREKLSSLVHVS